MIFKFCKCKVLKIFILGILDKPVSQILKSILGQMGYLAFKFSNYENQVILKLMLF